VLSRRLATTLMITLALAACGDQQDPTAPAGPELASKSANRTLGVNLVFKSAATPSMLARLGTYGSKIELIPQINGATMTAKASALPSIRALPFVASATEDAMATGSPVDAVSVADFLGGLSTWDQDAINATVQPFSAARAVSYTGEGVYVGVLDTGLLDTWRQYFPQERIATQYAKSFGGGLGIGNTPEEPNKWQHDVNAHGTHVTSTILGYQFGVNRINGTAPRATIIPVKVLGQTGSGSFSAIARGIVYVTDLALNQLAGHPVVINMSLGGPTPDALLEEAIDYAVANNVIIVASAGNSGDAGMGYPGAYQKVISVAAAGWVGEWKACGTSGSAANFRNWWVACDVADPDDASSYYISDFSSREKPGQDLDVAAPGSWVVGPYQLNSGKTNYFFLGGTSQASPHVAGIVALLKQKNPGLTAAQAEAILEGTALALPPGSVAVTNTNGTTTTLQTWGSDATGAGLARADQALALP
jgi:subtilisin family serine protease